MFSSNELFIAFVAPAEVGVASDVTAEAEGCGGGESPLAQGESLGKLLLGGAPSKINITRLTWRCKEDVGCRAAVTSRLCPKLQIFRWTSRRPRDKKKTKSFRGRIKSDEGKHDTDGASVASPADR